MMESPLLLQLLNNPKLACSFSLKEWQLLLVQASKANMLGRVQHLVEVNIPEQVKWHFSAGFKRVERQQQQAIREIAELLKTLNPLYDFMLLKGVAYLVHRTDNCFGRSFSDIDILVSKPCLKQIEFRLKLAGWIRTEVDDYDDKYYREWMHEIPPLTHSKRFTSLDVHHNILPRTNKQHFDASLFEFIEIDIEHVGKVKTLSKKDMLIHCAVHLFTESEFHNGLRDLYDLHLMMTEFQQESSEFMAELVARAAKLGLANYLFYAVRYSQLVFKTNLPENVVKILSAHAPKYLLVWDFAFLNVFKPDTKACRTWKTPIAKFLTYWRGHLIRMPLRLLVPHLIRKSWMQARDAFTKKPQEENPNLP